jgi:hypothetical protein
MSGKYLASSLGFANSFGVALNVVALIILLAIAFYSIRLLFIMKRGALEKSWRFVSMGSLMLVLGVIIFALVSAVPSLRMPGFVFMIGGIAMICGGFFLLLGLRVQYNLFHVRISYEKIDERTSDLV